MRNSRQGKSHDKISHNEIEKSIGYIFSNKNLLIQALTHRSYTNEYREEAHNERLEFLGDAILQFISTDKLYSTYPDIAEGEMSVYRSLLVKTSFLVAIAKKLGVPKYLRVSTGQKNDSKTKSSALFADATEALIGAIYLDGGLEAAKIFIFEKILLNMEEYLAKTPIQDAKTALQECTQEDNAITPTYVVLHEEGPAHARVFTVGVKIGDTMYAKGIEKTKQKAAQIAAKKLLKNIGKNGTKGGKNSKKPYRDISSTATEIER